MDRLGLPVYASIRPRGLTLRVHAGKSVHPMDARVGALLEAIEYAVAEPQRTAWDVETLSVAHLAAQWENRFTWADLAPVLGVRVTTRTKLEVIECEELVDGEPIRMPAELVFVPWQPGGNLRQIFGASTNGLASGNSLAEATLHALLEVMERDAISMNLPQDVSQWVEPAGLPKPFDALAAAWSDTGVSLAVRHVPNGFSLPCFQACLFQEDETHVKLAAGHGMHVNKGIALARAICEAAQSRLSHIHGGRDDIVGHYQRVAESTRAQRLVGEALAVKRWFDRSRAIAYASIGSGLPPAGSVGAMLGAVLSRLAASGFRTVCRYRFPIDLKGLHVVRVIVPGLEHVHGGGRRVGPRMLQQVVASGSR